ncbi:hypothetical protein, partial [Klebsiella pneumoniae]|uniref:hypothetical protein n=1 Tax=Klebsiella pneumoniae TaxID=573 RepID=UPI00273050EC
SPDIMVEKSPATSCEITPTNLNKKHNINIKNNNKKRDENNNNKENTHINLPTNDYNNKYQHINQHNTHTIIHNIRRPTRR